jgi:uncharacterized protein
MLTERDRMIVDLFARKVRERYPEARIWAFGSRARGDHNEESDLDMCVVTEQLTDEIRSTLSDLAWEVGFEHDLLITTVVFNRDGFENGPWRVSPLVQAILEEGVAA